MDKIIDINISSNELTKPVKVKRVRLYVENKGYSFNLENKINLNVASFKSIGGAERVKAHILEILNDMCENLNSDITADCSELYNCCDCGGNECGCAYCWSCNACSECHSENE